MSFRVMTYNILNGGEGREPYILNVIQTARPDVVILQEVYTEEFLKYLAHRLGMNHYMGEGNKSRKVALLSKLPVRSFNSYHPLLPIWRNFIDAEIEYEPNKTLRIIGVHPIANLGIVFEIWRLWEASYIVNHIRKFRNEPYLIAGDFNAIAPGEGVKIETFPNWLKWVIYLQGNRVYYFSIAKLLSIGVIDCFRSLNPVHSGFTLPPPDPNSRLDYIFINPEMKGCLKRCWVVREPGSVDLASDHYPVMAEFSCGDQLYAPQMLAAFQIASRSKSMMTKQYWEDLIEGQKLECKDTLFTKTEIMEFASKFDPLPFHIDEQAAEDSIFGGIIASSLHTLSACTRAVVDAQGDVAILSGLGLDEARMYKPVRPDDVLSIDAVWAGLRRSKSNPKRGFAGIKCKVSNQKGELVMEYGYRYMVECREEG